MCSPPFSFFPILIWTSALEAVPRLWSLSCFSFCCPQCGCWRINMELMFLFLQFKPVNLKNLSLNITLCISCKQGRFFQCLTPRMASLALSSTDTLSGSNASRTWNAADFPFSPAPSIHARKPVWSSFGVRLGLEADTEQSVSLKGDFAIAAGFCRCRYTLQRLCHNIAPQRKRRDEAGSGTVTTKKTFCMKFTL